MCAAEESNSFWTLISLAGVSDMLVLNSCCIYRADVEALNSSAFPMPEFGVSSWPDKSILHLMAVLFLLILFDKPLDQIY